MFHSNVFYSALQQRVPQGDYYTISSTDIPSENGGVSPRFARRLNVGNSDACERQFMRVLHKVNWTIERNEMRLADQDRRDYIKQEWQQVALVIDRMLMLCFTVLLTTITLSLFVPSDDGLDEIR